MKFGIDISEWQTGVDYEKAVKDGGVEFAILRAGFSTSVDDMFETHYNGFSPLVPVGAYLYSYAKSVDAAKAEAAAMAKWCAGKAFGLPVFLDMEESSVAALGKAKCTEIALAWCGEMEKAGYRAGVYANANWFRNYLDAAAIGEKYAIWCAAWSDTRPSEKRTDIWQFGGETNYLRSNAVAGVGKPVDQNYILNDSVLSNSKPEVPAKEDKEYEPTVLEWQKAAIADGFKFPKYGADGIWGPECESVAANAIVMQRGTYLYPNLTRIVQKVVGAEADGLCGPKTTTAIKDYQKSKGLTADGAVGINTWKSILL